jgi:hypothetical protein
LGPRLFKISLKDRLEKHHEVKKKLCFYEFILDGLIKCISQIYNHTSMFFIYMGSSAYM